MSQSNEGGIGCIGVIMIFLLCMWCLGYCQIKIQTRSRNELRPLRRN